MPTYDGIRKKRAIQLVYKAGFYVLQSFSSLALPFAVPLSLASNFILLSLLSKQSYKILAVKLSASFFDQCPPTRHITQIFD